jgi:hypothetical protein
VPDSILNLGPTAFFHILSNSLFIVMQSVNATQA